jgi:hypothetical protein
MRIRGLGALVAIVAAVPLVVVMSVPVAAQQRSQPHFERVTESAVPCARLSSYPKQPMTALPVRVIEPKRTAEGWPDLQGTWTSAAYAGGAQHSIEVGRDPDAILIQCRDAKSNIGNMLVDPMRGMIPYQPWAQAKRMENLAGLYAPTKRMDLPRTVLCFLPGVPSNSRFEANWELRYLPGRVVILSPANGGHRTARIISMDGSSHISDDVKLFMGDSRGHFEGNTLVVETRNNRDGTWFDTHGTFHSEAMRVVERWTMVDQDTLYYEATIIDPTVFTQPWKWAANYDRVKREYNNVTVEDACHEGERSVDRMVQVGLRARQAGITGYYIHVDLVTGKAIRPEEQKYLDESGQPLGFASAPMVPDEALSSKQ